MLNTAEAFFYEHAGWSYDPATQTKDEGRRETAQQLAAAEAWAKDNGYTYEWQNDWAVGDHVAEFDCYDEQPATCEYVSILDPWEDAVASLGCVDDADSNYRRVVEAQLALEAMPKALESALDAAADTMLRDYLNGRAS